MVDTSLHKMKISGAFHAAFEANVSDVNERVSVFRVDVEESTSPTHSITPSIRLCSAVLGCDGVEMQHSCGRERDADSTSFEGVGVGTERDGGGVDGETREWSRC